MLGSCKTREAGGCYCVCSLKDYENTLVNLLEGKACRYGIGIIYNPNREPTPLTGEEKEKTLKELDEVRSKLKDYEKDE